jgi:gliding motility-associated-like protein
MKLLYPLLFFFSFVAHSQNPYITVDVTTYTHEALVTEILIGSTCATVGNIESTTGTDFGNLNGIGYFENENPDFPIETGIILMTGDVSEAPGPAGGAQADGGWPGDAQLFNYIQSLGFDPGITGYRDATIMEFDFTPVTDSVSFNFVFASNEYGEFQCDYSDAFAFFLENQATGTISNLALVPNAPGEVPISVTTIRDGAHNLSCGSVNSEFFSTFYGASGLPMADSPINFFGHTVLMQAWSNVVPGTTYRMKLVIADRNDPLYNSAVFIEGGSFFLGDVDLGADLSISNGTARCEGESYTINSQLTTPPEDTTISWQYENPPGSGTFVPFVPAEETPTLVVTETGTYRLVVNYAGFCESEDTLFIEFDTPFTANPNPEPLVYCDLDNDGFGLFDLSAADADITFGDPNLSVTYYATQQNATNAVNPLPNLYTNTTPNQQEVWARVNRVYSSCFDVVPLTLEVINWLTVAVELDETYRLCVDASGNGITEEFGLLSPPLIETGLSNTQYNFIWEINGIVQPGETQSSIAATQEGEYTVIISDPVSGCEAAFSTNVMVSSPPFEYDAEVSTSTPNGNVITVIVEGLGTYEFSLNGGSFQESPVFENVNPGNHIITITDTNGCGSVDLEVSIVNYPLFFTPNNDGYNDTWHIGGLDGKTAVEIYIFDRFGKILKRLYADGEGWDGTYKGRPLPSSDYWFHLIYEENNERKELRGHFTMKR